MYVLFHGKQTHVCYNRGPMWLLHWLWCSPRCTWCTSSEPGQDHRCSSLWGTTGNAVLCGSIPGLANSLLRTQGTADRYSFTGFESAAGYFNTCCQYARQATLWWHRCMFPACDAQKPISHFQTLGGRVYFSVTDMQQKERVVLIS